jgi:hypothetical protein
VGMSIIAGANRLFPATLLLLCAVGDAVAQGRVEDDVRGITVLNRPRPEYDPPGVRVGSFTIRGGAGLDQGYNDNVLYSAQDKQGDMFSLMRADGRIESNWSRHGLGANAAVQRLQYYDLSDQSFTNFQVGLNGRYDLLPDTELAANVGYSVLHVLRTADDATTTDVPLRYDTRDAGLGIAQRFGRYRASVRGFYRHLDYDGFSRNGQFVQGSNQFNDRDVYGAAATLGYSLGPYRTVFTGVRAIRTDYTDVPRGFLDLSSDSYYGFVGFNYDFDGVWRYEFDVGYLYQQYDQSQIDTLSGLSGAARVTWAPTSLLAITASASRQINQQLLQAPGTANFENGFFSNRAGLSATYELFRNVLVTGGVAARYDEFRGPRGAALFLEETLEVNVLLDRNFRIGGAYIRQDTLNENASNPSRNVIALRLAALL